MKSSDPYYALEPCQIGIHAAWNAIEHFAENYPIDRLVPAPGKTHPFVDALRKAADTIERRVRDYKGGGPAS